MSTAGDRPGGGAGLLISISLELPPRPGKEGSASSPQPHPLGLLARSSSPSGGLPAGFQGPPSPYFPQSRSFQKTTRWKTPRKSLIFLRSCSPCVLRPSWWEVKEQEPRMGSWPRPAPCWRFRIWKWTFPKHWMIPSWMVPSASPSPSWHILVPKDPLRVNTSLSAGFLSAAPGLCLGKLGPLGLLRAPTAA